MARWRQDKTTGKMIPIDEEARKRDGGHSIHGIFEPFKSMVDGTLISTNRQLREHNKRNNVVNAGEFSQGHFEEKAKERANFYEGKHSRKETLKRKQEIYETMMRAERNG